ncbi:hypothetical protein AY599_01135 [Leptolyngbya valderiana BDU 20041]|nr:hypothetical protein AY599_01135 [Leptolyngbya valderiana BDU 20041]
MRTTIAAAAILAVAAAAAHAQTVGVTIDIDEPVLAPGDSTRVRLIATVLDTDYAFAGTNLNLLIDFDGTPGARGFSDLSILPPMDAGPTAGVPTDRGIEGIVIGQLHFPAAGIFADPTNPIAFWEATFTAPVDAGGGYRVDLLTETLRFDAWTDRDTAIAASRLDLIVEDSASIFVIPAPAGAAVLTLGVAVAFTQRRRPS